MYSINYTKNHPEVSTTATWFSQKIPPVSNLSLKNSRSERSRRTRLAELAVASPF